jgi:hypothetical protein
VHGLCVGVATSSACVCAVGLVCAAVGAASSETGEEGGAGGHGGGCVRHCCAWSCRRGLRWLL